MKTIFNNEAVKGRLLIIAAAMLWGTTGTSQALAPLSASSLTVGAMRIIIGCLPLLAISLTQGGFRTKTSWHIPTVLIAGISTAAYQLLFFSGVRLAGVAVGTLVGIGSAPIFAGLLGKFFENEHLDKRWFTGTGLAVVGCILLSIPPDGSLNTNFFGLLLALGAGLTYTIFTLVNKRLIAKHSSHESMAVSFCLGAFLLLPVLFLSPTKWITTPGGAAVTLYLGLIATGLSYFFFGRGLRSVRVSTVGALTLAEPLTAGLLGVLLLGEQLTTLAVIGLCLLFGGLATLTTQHH